MLPKQGLEGTIWPYMLTSKKYIHLSYNPVIPFWGEKMTTYGYIIYNSQTTNRLKSMI